MNQPDPRSMALASYLRQRSAAFSLSADATDSAPTARAGMALLDAAELAERLGPDDPVIAELSEAGFFESMPGQHARFLETAEIRRAIQRPIAGSPANGARILDAIVLASRRS